MTTAAELVRRVREAYAADEGQRTGTTYTAPHAAAGSPAGGQFTSTNNSGSKKSKAKKPAPKPAAKPAAAAPAAPKASPALMYATQSYQEFGSISHRTAAGDPRITAVQTLMRSLGMPIAANGKYDEAMQAQVKAMQLKLGLSPTGRVTTSLMKTLQKAAILSPCARESTMFSAADLVRRVRATEGWEDQRRAPQGTGIGGRWVRMGAVVAALRGAGHPEAAKALRANPPKVSRRGSTRWSPSDREVRGHARATAERDQLREQIARRDEDLKAPQHEGGRMSDPAVRRQTRMERDEYVRQLAEIEPRVAAGERNRALNPEAYADPLPGGDGPVPVVPGIGPEIELAASRRDLTAQEIARGEHVTPAGRQALDSLGAAGHPQIAAIPDTEAKVRAAYRMLAIPGGGSDNYVALSDIRKLIGEQAPRADVDATLKQMSRTDGVHLTAQSYHRGNAETRIPASVRLGGQEQNLLHIADPALARPSEFGAVAMAEELHARRTGGDRDPMMALLGDAELQAEVDRRAARDPLVAEDLRAMRAAITTSDPSPRPLPSGADRERAAVPNDRQAELDDAAFADEMAAELDAEFGAEDNLAATEDVGDALTPAVWAAQWDATTSDMVILQHSYGPEMGQARAAYAAGDMESARKTIDAMHTRYFGGRQSNPESEKGRQFAALFALTGGQPSAPAPAKAVPAKKTAAAKVARAKASKRPPADIAASVDAATSAEEADAHLEGLTVPELSAVATAMGFTPLTKNKAKLRRQVTEMSRGLMGVQMSAVASDPYERPHPTAAIASVRAAGSADEVRALLQGTTLTASDLEAIANDVAPGSVDIRSRGSKPALIDLIAGSKPAPPAKRSAAAKVKAAKAAPPSAPVAVTTQHAVLDALAKDLRRIPEGRMKTSLGGMSPAATIETYRDRLASGELSPDQVDGLLQRFLFQHSDAGGSIDPAQRAFLTQAGLDDSLADPRLAAAIHQALGDLRGTDAPGQPKKSAAARVRAAKAAQVPVDEMSERDLLAEDATIKTPRSARQKAVRAEADAIRANKAAPGAAAPSAPPPVARAAPSIDPSVEIYPEFGIPVTGRNGGKPLFGGVPSQAPMSARREVEVENAIRAAFVARARGAGETKWLKLTDLRAELGDRFTREEVDNVLLKMNRRPDATVTPELNQKTLTPAERSAAVIIGNQDKHAIHIGDPRPLPLPDSPASPTPSAPAPRTAAEKVTRAKAAIPPASEVRVGLDRAQSEEDATAYLAGLNLTVADLRQLAGQLGVPLSHRTKSGITANIVKVIVAGRLATGVIQRF